MPTVVAVVVVAVGVGDDAGVDTVVCAAVVAFAAADAAVDVAVGIPYVLRSCACFWRLLCTRQALAEGVQGQASRRGLPGRRGAGGKHRQRKRQRRRQRATTMNIRPTDTRAPIKFPAYKPRAGAGGGA